MAYAIGVAKPVSLMVNTFRNPDKVSTEKIVELICQHFDLCSMHHRISHLLRPIYGKTAAYGHFGQDDLFYLGEHRQGGGIEGSRWSVYFLLRIRAGWAVPILPLARHYDPVAAMVISVNSFLFQTHSS